MINFPTRKGYHRYVAIPYTPKGRNVEMVILNPTYIRNSIITELFDQAPIGGVIHYFVIDAVLVYAKNSADAHSVFYSDLFAWHEDMMPELVELGLHKHVYQVKRVNEQQFDVVVCPSIPQIEEES